jgi:hypothetical protein
LGKVEVYRPYVEKLLKELLETDNLIVDGDGDVPIRRGTAMYYVRMIDGDPVAVRVFSVLLRGVKRNAKLLEKLNDLNCEVGFARLMHCDGDVIASMDMVAETVDKDSLDFACNRMGWLADTYDDELKNEFGGETWFPDDGSTPEGETEVET